MTKLWHCTPAEFLEQDMDMIDLHIAIYSEENKADLLNQKRGEQKIKSKK